MHEFAPLACSSTQAIRRKLTARDIEDLEIPEADTHKVTLETSVFRMLFTLQICILLLQ